MGKGLIVAHKLPQPRRAILQNQCQHAARCKAWGPVDIAVVSPWRSYRVNILERLKQSGHCSWYRAGDRLLPLLAQGQCFRRHCKASSGVVLAVQMYVVMNQNNIGLHVSYLWTAATEIRLPVRCAGDVAILAYMAYWKCLSLWCFSSTTNTRSVSWLARFPNQLPFRLIQASLGLLEGLTNPVSALFDKSYNQSIVGIFWHVSLLWIATNSSPVANTPQCSWKTGFLVLAIVFRSSWKRTLLLKS